MIKHVVCWKIKDFAEGRNKAENISLMKDLLISLKGKLREIKTLEVGINSQLGSTSNDDLVLITTHDSLSDLEAYQKHPEHVKVAEFVGKIKESCACVDFEFK